MACNSIQLLFFFFLLSFNARFSDGEDNKDECLDTHRCSDSEPEIRFPLRLKEQQQPHHCGYPGLELSCNGSKTVLRLPYAPELFVAEIDYLYQRLYIKIPTDGCLAGWLMSLNFSASPFTNLQSIILVNCSSMIDSTSSTTDFFEEVSCLDSPGHHVYVAHSYIPPPYCNKIQSVPLPYPAYREWRYFDMTSRRYITLDWKSPCCFHCERQGGRCRYKNTTAGDGVACSHTPPHQGSPFKKPLIIGASIGFALLLVALVVVIKIYSARKGYQKIEMENQLKIEKFLEDYKSLTPTRYSHAEIRKMSCQFKTKLGQGGNGSVFKGMLPSGCLVAVKIVKESMDNAEEFINEVGTIGKIHHINVVRLVGFCAEGFKKALVYEFMQNGSLEKLIFSLKTSEELCNWEKINSIAIGIAKGIEYLHQGCDQLILHFDIKPHNILLDENFNPKISDFGLAKLCSKRESIVSMVAARGTIGYIAPEVFSRNFGNVSYKSDVYSFGMLLLEMVGGRKNIDVTMENTSQVYFPEWIYNHLVQEGDLGIRVDVLGDREIAKKLTIVGLWCIQWYPTDRPSMKNVVQMLEGSMENLRMPPNPFASQSSIIVQE